MIWKREVRPEPSGAYRVVWHFRGTESPGNRHTTDVVVSHADLREMVLMISLKETGGGNQAQYIEIDGYQPIEESQPRWHG